IILCQQGVRISTDIAPNIEAMGAMSMPTVPEFFEGQPLEKSVIYPELPPSTRMFDTDMLPGGAGEKQQQPFTDEQNLLAAALSAPEPVTTVDRVAITQRLAAPHSEEQQQPTAGKVTPVVTSQPQQPSAMSRLAYIQYRELSAQLELRQTEELHGLLDSTAPLTEEERKRVEQYKAANKKPKKPRTPRTEEQKQAAKQAAERRKLAHDAFLSALTPEDRELYLTEQKLQKTREATIRKLKRMAADRKILDKLPEE
ncbi:MAG: hypothetical protein K2L88_02225, partial [Clostridiales bacterium]|nr:hypothetical protein [Clostridiales bacterium]